MTEREDRVKHLEMIQLVIARLANNSFLVKGWSITVAGAFYGFALTTQTWQLALASAVPTLLFWWLDAYFLFAERRFRCLFDEVRQESWTDPFFLAATSPEFRKRLVAAGKSPGSVWDAGWRPTVWALYAVLLAAAVGIAAAAAALPESAPLP